MAQQQKTPQDPYAKQTKALASAVQRLRGWVGSDPTRAPELGDALVALTGHRLQGHAYAAAATEAQESARRAAELLTAQGAIGPYTEAADAARYVTAVIQVATVQSGLGLVEPAGRTLAALDELGEQLQDLSLANGVSDETRVWGLVVLSRAAGATGQPGAASAYADAASALLAAAGLRDPADVGYLALDVERCVADSRWALGRADEALSHLHAAQDHYDAVVAGRLDEPGRLSPGLLERLAEPLFGLYRDLADRLVANGDVDLGLVTRRRLVETLRGLVGRLGDPARVQLAAALTDLATDLAAVGRTEEAAAAAAEAASLPATTAIRPRSALSRPELVATAPPPDLPWWAAGTSLSTALTRGAESAEPASDWLEAERAEAHRIEAERLEQARIEADRRRSEQRVAELMATERQAAERAEAVRAAQDEAARQAAEAEAERLATQRRREERLEEHRREVEPVDQAHQEWQRAKAAGDRKRARAANERLVELLRPRAEDDPNAYGKQLYDALDELASARLRSGDLFGSRAIAKEAKALARTLGR